jgi:hypothetical protein
MARAMAAAPSTLTWSAIVARIGAGRNGGGGRMDWSHAPRQVDGIEVNPVADGYIVYQPDRDRVHYLNHTAVLVLELCDGQLPAGDIPRLLRDAYDLSAPPTDQVAECLTKLLDEGLVR